MKTLFRVDRIIDRDNYVYNLSRYIDECVKSEHKSVIFLYGETGLGKSSIMHKLRYHMADELPILIIDTPPVNLDTTPQQGQFLSYIAQALNNYYKSTIWSLEFILTNSLSKHQNYIEAESLLGAAHSLGSAIIALIGKNLIKGQSNLERVFWSLDVDSLLILKEYIQLITSTQNIILDVTNAQNMDAMTASILKENFFENNDSKLLFFEYTTKNDDDKELFKLAEMYHNTNTHLIIEKVTPLPIEFALTLYNNDKFCISELEKFYHDIIKGNLYKLYKLKNSENSFLSSVDPLSSIISRLSYGAKLLLAIICLHNGTVSRHLLDVLISKFSDFYYINDSVFVELESVLYTDSQGNVALEHASVMDSFGMTIDNHAVASARKLLIDYYDTEGHDAKFNNQNAFICLLRCYSITMPSKIISLFSEFKVTVLESFSADKAFSFIENAFNILGPKCDINLRLHIVNLCHDLGLFAGAYSLLNRIDPPFTCSYYALRCMLLDRIEKYEEVIKLCHDLLPKYHINSRLSLILQMVQMLSERSLNNNHRSYWKIFRKLINNQAYKDYDEYGFLLRNSHIVYSYNESLPFLQESIDFFTNRNNFTYAAHSSLTYAVQRARLGFLHESQSIIDKIKPVITSETFEKHTLLCNEIAIRLLMHDKTQNTMILIEQALLTAESNFDKLVLLNNYLCFYILNHVRGPLLERLVGRMVDLAEIEPDKRHVRKTFTNIYLYYKNVTNEINKINHWRNKAMDIKIKNDKLTDSFLDIRPATLNYKFLTSHPFCVFFITSWNFPIPVDDL